MLGSTASVPTTVEGSSLKDLADATTQHISRNNSLIFHSPHYDLSPNKRPESAIRNDSFKFMVDYELGEFYLYDLINDIEEQDNLKDSLPAVTASLCLELRDYLKAVGASMPSLNPAHISNNGPVGDYDNDGLNDGWEFTELLTHRYDGTDDPDNDGFNNATEFMNATDPHVPNVSSIYQIKEKTVFTVFPNPSSTEIQVEGNLEFDQLYLYDYTGKKLIQKTKKDRLNVRKLRIGIYFLVIKNKGEIIYTEEIAIQR